MASQKREQGYDWLVKLLIIGDSGVGKTNILLRFCENNFTPSHLTTIGIDFKIKVIDVDGKKLKLQVWDTAGQERFRTITQTYYKGAQGIILTYAVNDRETFTSIENWMKQIKLHASENVCKILIGNKCDMSERQVEAEEGRNLALSYGIHFFETSAKDNKNISETFQEISKEIKQKMMENEATTKGQVDETKSGVSLKINQNDKPTKKKTECC